MRLKKNVLGKMLVAAALVLGGVSACAMKDVRAEEEEVVHEAVVSTFDELKEAFLNEDIDTIYVAADIDVPCGNSDFESDYKSKSAALVADRDLVIQGLNGNSYTLKRTVANETDGAAKCRSILEVYGDGSYDGIQVSIMNLVLDGGADWTKINSETNEVEIVPVENRRGGSGIVWSSNRGLAGRAIIDVANKGTINLEYGAVLRNAQTSVNSQTRNAVGYSGGGSSCYGAGIRIEYSNANGGGTANLKMGAVIEDCSSVSWGGAIGAYNYGRLNIYGGNIRRCSSEIGAAICCTYRAGSSSSTTSTMKMYGGTIEECYSPGYGIINLDGTNPEASEFTGGIIRNCTGYAINATESSKLDIAPYDGVNIQISNVTAGNLEAGSYAAEYGIRSANIDNVVFVDTYYILFTDGNRNLGNISIKKDTASGSSFPGDPVKDGYVFTCWKDSTGNIVDADTVIKSNLVLNANWKNKHYHGDFTYSVSGNKLTATCGGQIYPENCELINKKISIELKHTVGTLEGDELGWYEKDEYNFMVDKTDADAWEEIFDDGTSAVLYEGTGETQYEASATKPEAAGSYRAMIGSDDHVVAIDFVISHNWGEYTSCGDATTEADGHKSRTCSACDAVDTVVDEGSKLEQPTEESTEEPGSGDGDGTGTSDGDGTGTSDGYGDGAGQNDPVKPATKGDVVTVGDASYEVLVTAAGKEEVAYTVSKNAATTVTVPDEVTINGVKYKVTSIKANAFKNNKKLKKITIGKYIKKIGKNAFYGCKNLKSIKIKTTKLTKKSVGKNAFAKINKKAKIKVPKKKLKAYKKLLKARGIKAKSQKVTK